MVSSVTLRDTELIKEYISNDYTMLNTEIHRMLKEDGASFGGTTTKWAISASGTFQPFKTKIWTNGS